MTRTRLLVATAAFTLLIAACGDSGGGDTTLTSVTGSTDATTTTVGATTSVVPPAGEEISPLHGDLVQDPFFDSGFHSMDWADEPIRLVSAGSITGGGGPDDLLAITPLGYSPTVTGVTADQRLVFSYVDNWTGDVVPHAVVLYNPSAEGWLAYAAIDSGSIMDYLETTTDYQARTPDSFPVLQFTLDTFDWTGNAAFTANVAVFDFVSGDEAYSSQIFCTIEVGVWECETLSDDGILRPGDEGDDVSALQEDLSDLGYYAGAVTGVYDEDTEDAVRLLQRDYWLTRDGRAGPQTLGLIDELTSGTSNLVLIGPGHIGDVSFGTPAVNAMNQLIGIFGTPDNDTGWFVDACDGRDWRELSWDGFTAIHTDRDGPHQLDGWEVNDISDLPSVIRIEYGIRPTWTWRQLRDILDAGWEPFFEVWTQNDIGYNDGHLVPGHSNPPGDGDGVLGLGTGTGAFVSC